MQSKTKDPGSSSTMRRQLAKIQALPRALASLYKKFAELIDPLEPRFDIVWGLVYLTLRVRSPELTAYWITNSCSTHTPLQRG